ncbi:hypothetical protein NAC44_15760 [Allorhizobium sp. BGMRC 0089]|uniref:hypothetical protein n=1 Tax=Allorhizobium sonneratiae TaxID=2934936 RepID=UPI0020343756|nr:hypothetical protein [Allorhizobium sonneratiae]MCM2293783.1 hypothetical protein [Allorhizobium sonneratiae]
MNDANMFAALRAPLFSGRLAQPQVDGIHALLAETRAQSLSLHQTAYVLATAYHETAKTMQPIAEYGKGKGRPYGVPGRNHGQIAYGRGFVQTTWDRNYERTDRELGLNGRLIADYDLLLTDIDLAAKAAVTGMVQGWYTGKKLADYIGDDRCDFVNARRIINGIDRAELIAGYAHAFFHGFEAGDAGAGEA